MYNITRRQYIFKMLSGQYLNIYYKPNTGLCCSKLTSSGTWTSPSVILKDALPGFSACLDTSDNIHLLCQNEESNILYMSCTDGSWFSKPVSRSKRNDMYDKHPYICSLNNKIYIFYVIESSEKKLLVYQTYSEDGFTVPKAIDYIRISTRAYTVLHDQNGAIFIFYATPGEKSDPLRYRILNADGYGWSDYFNINSGMNLSRVHILSVAASQTGDFHLSLQKASVQKYEIIYLKIPACKQNQCSEVVLTSSPYNFLNSSLLVLGKKLIIYWVREDIIFYCMSADNGITWSKPEKYVSFDKQFLFCTRLYSNDSENNMDIISTDIPAIISTVYQPVFKNELKDKNVESLVIEDFETSFLSAMKILTITEEINETLSKTEQEVENSEAKVYQFNNNYNKYINLKLQTDRDILNLKTGIEQIKALKTC